MHVLLIEPQPLVAMMLEDELRRLGFTSFDVAVTQNDAVAAALHRKPDLITACVRLVEGCGMDAAQIICAHQSIPTIYIVSNIEEAVSPVSGSIVIAKPMMAHELEEAVQQVMQQTDTQLSKVA